jgi:hypothetical protein
MLLACNHHDLHMEGTPSHFAQLGNMWPIFALMDKQGTLPFAITDHCSASERFLSQCTIRPVMANPVGGAVYRRELCSQPHCIASRKMT